MGNRRSRAARGLLKLGPMRRPAWIVALLALCAGSWSAFAAKPAPLEKRDVVQNTPAGKSLLKIRRYSLPEEQWRSDKHGFRGADRHALGKIIKIEERGNKLIRREETDGPVINGRFERIVHTTIGSKGPIAKTTGPRWSAQDARFLFSKKKLGPMMDHKKGTVTMNLWWPEAQKVELHLIDDNKILPMHAELDGVWTIEAGKTPAQLNGKRYQFLVDGKAIPDPYGRSQVGDKGPSRFVDTRFKWTDRKFVPPKRTADWVIEEVHIGDETNAADSPVPAALRGTYAGMAHPSVVQYYKDLGVNAIEVMPVMQSVEGKHWGYMTSGFFAAADRFASRPENALSELQNMVNEYHKAGIAVVMDVVYNHTANGAPQFQMFNDTYFHRTKPDGSKYDAGGVGNEMASENPMARKLILESKRFWQEEVHIDGFRDDLGGIIDRATMRKSVRLKLNRDMQTKRRFATSEPWAWDKSRELWHAGDFDGTSARPISAWDSNYREASKAFMLGHGNVAQMKTMVAGNVRPYGPGATPESTTKYNGSHDEKTPADLAGWKGEARARLALGILAVSQGPLMLDHAQEIMRSKGGRSNLYDDPVNGRKPWSQVKSSADVLSFTRGMIKFRNTTPYFRYGRALTANDISWMQPRDGYKDTAFGFVLKAPADAKPPQGGGKWPEVIVLTNSEESTWTKFDLPPGNWKVITDGVKVDANQGVSAPAVGDYGVPPKSMVMLSRL